MRSSHHLHHDPYFHAHPMHVMFSLIAGIVLAGILVLLLVDAAR